MTEAKTRVWTIRELMKFAIDHLQRKGFDEARLNVELLLAHALNCQRIELYTNFDKPVAPQELSLFRKLLERRLNREPVQYIVGWTSFMGLPIAVDKRVLIPRPETETLVEQVMMYCTSMGTKQSFEILDVGTGSGNIAIAVAKYVKNARVTTIDVSQDAIAVAEVNVRVHGLNDQVELICADVFGNAMVSMKKKFDILVCNPPYVPKDEWLQLQMEVQRFEPASAVTDGNDGFRFYRRLVELSPLLLNTDGALFVEVGYNQAEHVASLLKRAGFGTIAITPDLQGIPRVVSGTIGASISAASLN